MMEVDILAMRGALAGGCGVGVAYRSPPSKGDGKADE